MALYGLAPVLHPAETAQAPEVHRHEATRGRDERVIIFAHYYTVGLEVENLAMEKSNQMRLRSGSYISMEYNTTGKFRATHVPLSPTRRRRHPSF